MFHFLIKSKSLSDGIAKYVYTDLFLEKKCMWVNKLVFFFWRLKLLCTDAIEQLRMLVWLRS